MTRVVLAFSGGAQTSRRHWLAEGGARRRGHRRHARSRPGRRSRSGPRSRAGARRGARPRPRPARGVRARVHPAGLASRRAVRGSLSRSTPRSRWPLIARKLGDIAGDRAGGMPSRTAAARASGDAVRVERRRSARPARELDVIALPRADERPACLAVEREPVGPLDRLLGHRRPVGRAARAPLRADEDWTRNAPTNRRTWSWRSSGARRSRSTASRCRSSI